MALWVSHPQWWVESLADVFASDGASDTTYAMQYVLIGVGKDSMNCDIFPAIHVTVVSKTGTI